ncbi:MAG: hypothetical protein HDT29_03340 [Clostridiales bacterium]|nr:hypothetical protein [Clostridiales bacterium]
MKNAMFDKEWFKLDNAAKIYPAARSSRWNAVFRMAVVMKEEVKPDILQQALDDIIDRFPTFQVTLKKGFFWYYFQYVNEKPKIEEENDYPCSIMRLTGRGHVFRVLYHSHRISVEVFHSITDGTGNITFLKTLVSRYCELCGATIEDYGDILHFEDDPTPEEVEDSFSRYLDKSKGTLPRREEKAYQIKCQKEKRGVLNVTQGSMPFEQLHKVAKSFGCTINTYLTAVLAYVVLNRQLYEKRNKKRPVRVQVPINLRKMFPSCTLRNFAGYYNTTTQPVEQTFEEIVKDIGAQLKEKITPEYCQKFINSNVSLEKNPVIRIAPRFIKTLFMNMSFYMVGENLMSCSFSNIGNVVTPKELYDYIDRFEFVIGPQKYMNHAMTCASYNGASLVTFSRTSKDPTLERDFFAILTKHGIDVTVNSNRR